jgi:hypothetical protein
VLAQLNSVRHAGGDVTIHRLTSVRLSNPCGGDRSVTAGFVVLLLLLASLILSGSALAKEGRRVVPEGPLEEPTFSVSGQSSTTGAAATLTSGPVAPISSQVSNSQGDIVEISTAHPSPYYKEGSTYWVQCTAAAQPYIGSSFDPCGNVYLYDATRKSSTEVPDTNEQEDIEYDACGTKVSSGGTHGWHVEGTEYMRSGWVGGHVATIPASEPTSCLGTWKLVYSFTETFSDGEKLTDTVEVPFTVTALPISASATWGGGNPSDLFAGLQRRPRQHGDRGLLREERRPLDSRPRPRLGDDPHLQLARRPRRRLLDSRARLGFLLRHVPQGRPGKGLHHDHQPKR